MSRDNYVGYNLPEESERRTKDELVVFRLEDTSFMGITAGIAIYKDNCTHVFRDGHAVQGCRHEVDTRFYNMGTTGTAHVWVRR